MSKPQLTRAIAFAAALLAGLVVAALPAPRPVRAQVFNKGGCLPQMILAKMPSNCVSGPAGSSGSRLFDDTTNEIITTSTSAAINNLGAITIGAWIYPTSTGTGGAGSLIVKDGANAYSQFVAFGSAGTFGATFGYSVSPASSSTNTTPTLNQWTYVLVTCDINGDALVHIYYNNVEVSYIPFPSQTTGSGTVTDNSASGFSFGSDTYGDTWGGNIAEVAVWNEALSSGNRAAAYASTTGVAGIDASHLVGYWHLCGKASPEPDSSSSGNNGTLSSPAPAGATGSPGYSGC